MDQEKLVEIVAEIVKGQLGITGTSGQQEQGTMKIPVGISNRHVHLSEQDLIQLFGSGATLTKLKDLSQPGQFACEQMVTLVGLKGVIERVRVLGPLRDKTQVEISISDGFSLGIRPPIRDSGDLAGSAGLTLVGPVGSITLKEGCIVAARHIHMHPSDAQELGVYNGDRVNVKCSDPRATIFSEVLIRVSENYRLEMHVDMDEANAACLKNEDNVEIAVSNP